MIGRTVSHYTILRKLGQGGMGEVYLARDTILHRQVALKFLSERLEQDVAAKRRFVREAMSAAAIDHPYICKIYEIGEAEEQTFLALEYLEGPTLREKLDDGPLPLEQAVETALEITEALEEAHKRGIIHRDLKPSNIMLTSMGHAKVTDFGLAKQIVSDGCETLEETLTQLTKEGAALGTVSYMSPEQVTGGEVDPRSDLFSLGIIFYEMLTGVHPFRQPEALETVSAILRDDPAPPARYRNEISEVLQHAVLKMLAKDPDRRTGSAHEFRTDLLQVKQTAPNGPVPSSEPAAMDAGDWVRKGGAAAFLALLAVLVWNLPRDWLQPSPELVGNRVAVVPFENETGDTSLDPLGRLVAESIVRLLAEEEHLQTVPTLRVFEVLDQGDGAEPFLKGEAQLAVLASRTAARILVSGTYYRVADNLRFQPRMVRQEDWSYEAPAVDGPESMVEDLVDRVAEQTSIRLSASARHQFLDPRHISRLPSLEAWREFRAGQDKSQYAINFFEAAGHMERSLQLEPDYWIPRLYLADWAANWPGNWDRVRALEILEPAKALRPESTQFERLWLDLYLAYVTGDWASALDQALAILELVPNQHEARFKAVENSYRANRLLETIAHAKALEETFPPIGGPRFTLSWVKKTRLSGSCNRQSLKATQTCNGSNTALTWNPYAVIPPMNRSWQPRPGKVGSRRIADRAHPLDSQLVGLGFGTRRGCRDGWSQV